MSFYVDVQSAGSVVNNGPIASVSEWSYSARMDRAGAFSLSMPATDTRATYMQHKRTVHAYALMAGLWQEAGAGLIDRIEYKPQPDGKVIMTVSGDDLLAELRSRSVGFLEIGTAATPATFAEAITAIVAFAPAGWSFYPSYEAETNEIYARFAGESVLAAIVAVAEKSRVHFYRGSGRNLYFAREFPQSGIRAIRADGDLSAETCAIDSLRQRTETLDYANRIYPYGTGTGAARLTIVATDRVAPTGYTLSTVNNYIQHDAGVSTHGVWEEHAEYKRVGPLSNTDADFQAAANQLFDNAILDLSRRADDARAFYDLSVSQAARLLRPCESVRTVYNEPSANLRIDADLNILEARLALRADTVRLTGLTLATVDEWPASDAEMVAGRLQQSKVFSAYPQTNANAYWVAHRVFVGESQTEDKSDIPIILGNEVVTVAQVKFRVKVSQVQTFTGTAGGEASADLTVSGTVDIPSHTHSVPGHNHDVFTSGFLGAAGTVGVSGAGGVFTNSTGGDITVSSSSSSGGTTSDGGGSQTALDLDISGSVDVGGAITTTYGMTQVSGGLTFAESDLEWTIDAGSNWFGVETGTLISGYREFDITSDVSDSSTFRPLGENFTLTFRRKTAGSTATPPDEMTAMLDILVGIRDTIQAINYS